MHTIAEQYFEFRARLGTSLFAVSRLAQEKGLAETRLPLLQSLISSLREPFVFVVVGEVNTGKSTFLNALFGEEFSQAGVVPTTERIIAFKHGEEYSETPLTDTLTEIRCNNDFLKDFNIVDTPGTNSIADEHQQITERFVPIADLVIFVFSVTNPWGASTWEFLERIHRSWMKNIVFVLQQCDLRAPEDIEEVIEHMKVTSQKKLGRVFPIFPVSAKQAFLAKTSKIDSARMLESSGFHALEKHIGSSVGSTSRRLEKLRSVVDTARIILDEIRERMTEEDIAIRDKREAKTHFNQTVYQQRERTRAKFTPVINGLDHRYSEVTNEGNQFLDSRFGFAKSITSLFRKDETLPKLQRRVVQRLNEEARATLTGAADIIEDDLRHLWVQFNHHLATEPNQPPQPVPDWTPQRKRLLSQFEGNLEQFITDVDLPSALDPLLKRRRFILGGGMLFCLGLAIISGVVFAAFPTPFVLIPLGLLLLGGVGCLMSVKAQSQRIRNAFGSTIAGSRETLRGRITQGIDLQINSYFSDFLRLFNSSTSGDSALDYEDQDSLFRQYEGLSSAFEGFARQLATNSQVPFDL